MHISKGQELVPIEFCYLVFSRTIVIANGVHDGRIQRRQLIGSEIFFTEELVNRASRDASEKFAFRIGPAIVFGAGDVLGTGSNERNQLVSIDWKLVGIVGIFLVIRGKPITIGIGYGLDGLAIVAASQ